MATPSSDVVWVALISVTHRNAPAGEYLARNRSDSPAADWRFPRGRAEGVEVLAAGESTCDVGIPLWADRDRRGDKLPSPKGQTPSGSQTSSANGSRAARKPAAGAGRGPRHRASVEQSAKATAALVSSRSFSASLSG